MDITISEEYEDLIYEPINLNFRGRRKFYVYLDYTSDGETYYYVGKGTGDRALNEKRNDIHVHYKKQRGLDRRIIIDNLTEKEALDFENIFIHFSIQSGVYLTNIVVEEFRFNRDYAFDEILIMYIDCLKESSFNDIWISNLVKKLNEFAHIEIIIILLESYLNVEKNNLCLDDITAMLIKDSIKNENCLSRIYLNSVIKEVDSSLEDEEFDSFLAESLKIAESIEGLLDIIIQKDRCISKLQNNLPSTYLIVN